MFGFLFNRKRSVEPLVFTSVPVEIPWRAPSQKQLNYAAKLGIPVTPSMSMEDVSEAISDYEDQHPEIKHQREEAKRRRQERERAKLLAECGPEMLAAEKRWAEYAENDGFLLATFKRGGKVGFDLLCVLDAEIVGDKKKHLSLFVAAPKIARDREFGDYLEWEKEFDLKIEHLLHFEPTNEPDMYDIDRYKAVVAWGLEQAKRFSQ